MPAFTAASSADSDPDRPRCSARGCTAAARWSLRWRNPTLHSAARVKTWLSCPEHRDHLADFLARRGFLLGTDELPEAELSAAPTPAD